MMAQDSLPLELMIPIGHSSMVSSLEITPDGNYIVSTGLPGVDPSIRIWNLANGREIRSLPADVCGGISSDGQSLISAMNTGMVSVIDFESGNLIREFSTGEMGIAALKIAPTQGECAVAFVDGNIAIWDYETGKELRRFSTKVGYVSALNFAEYGGRLMVTSFGQNVIVFNSESGAEVFHQESSGKGALSKDGEFVAVVDLASQNISVWNVQSGKEIGKFLGAENLSMPIIQSCAFTNEDQLLVAGFQELDLWNFEEKKVILKIENIVGGIHSMNVSGDGAHFTTGNTSGKIKVWDGKSGRELRTLEGSANKVHNLAVSANGRSILSNYTDKIQHWNLDNGIEFNSVKGSGGLVMGMDVSSDGKTLVLSEGSKVIWTELSSANQLESLDFELPFVPDLVKFSQDGSYLIVTSRSGGIKVVDNATKIVHSLPDSNFSIGDFTVSADGQYIAACSVNQDGFFGIWELQSGNFLGQFENPSSDWSDFQLKLAFTPDSQQIVAGTAIGSLQVWDVSTRTLMQIISTGQDPVMAVALSANGEKIASATLGGLKITELETGELLTVLSPLGIYTSLEWCNNDRYVISAGQDHSVSIWDILKGEKQASLISIGELDWMVTVPSSPLDYYQSSKQAAEKIGYSKGLKSYSFEQFDLQFNRPDLVQERLDFADSELIVSYRKAHRKRLDKMGFQASALSGNLNVPEVQILSMESIPISTTERSLRINVLAKDASEPLDRINVWINDVPIYGTAGISLKKQSKKELKIPIDLSLSEGENVVQISTLSQSGVESLKESFNIECTADVEQANLYVLAFGVSEYHDSNFDLNFASKDASDVAAFFVDSEQYAETFTELYVNDEVTKSNMKAARSFLEKADIDDQVLVYISGHGLLDSELDFYFATHDTDFSNPKNNAILYDEIEGLLDGIPARKKLLLMDACHSGEVDKEATVAIADAGNLPQGVKGQAIFGSDNSEADSFALMQELFSDLRRGTGAHVISSASGTEFSYEGDGFDNGLFTYAFLYGLKTGDADTRTGNKDGEITVSEIRDYVSEAVSIMSKGKQSPTSRRENLQFDFRVY